MNSTDEQFDQWLNEINRERRAIMGWFWLGVGILAAVILSAGVWIFLTS